MENIIYYILAAVIIALVFLTVRLFRLSKTVGILSKKPESKPDTAAVTAAAPEKASAEPVNSRFPSQSFGEIELVDTDEPTAAVIMAIVSDKADIPLNTLRFKRIKLLREEDRK